MWTLKKINELIYKTEKKNKTKQRVTDFKNKLNSYQKGNVCGGIIRVWD